MIFHSQVEEALRGSTNGGVPLTPDLVVNEQVTNAKNIVAYAEGGKAPTQVAPPKAAGQSMSLLQWGLTVGVILLALCFMGYALKKATL